MIILGIGLCIIGIFLIIFGLIAKTKDTISFIVGKAVPVFMGLYCILCVIYGLLVSGIIG